jgi:hypothetical protein
MAHKKLDGVQQIASGTGAGSLALGVATSALYRTMQAAGMVDGDTAYFRIQHETIALEWEIVKVALSSGTITRTFDEASKSATGSLISFTAGNKIVSGVEIAVPIIKPLRVITSGTTTAMTALDYEVSIKKSVGAPHAVTLPPNPVFSQYAMVSDSKGDAGTNNITISAHAGTINGAASMTIRVGYGAAKFRYSGTEWNTVY